MDGDNVWLENARRANERAKTLAEKLTEALGGDLAFPCEASAVFLRMPDELVVQLHDRGWHFYKFVEPDVYRLMCSWSVTEEDIDDFIKDERSSVSGNSPAV